MTHQVNDVTSCETERYEDHVRNAGYADPKSLLPRDLRPEAVTLSPPVAYATVWGVLAVALAPLGLLLALVGA